MQSDRILWGAPSLWINVFPLYLGIDRGFFSDRGIDIHVKCFHGGPERIDAIKTGDEEPIQ